MILLQRAKASKKSYNNNTCNQKISDDNIKKNINPEFNISKTRIYFLWTNKIVNNNNNNNNLANNNTSVPISH